MRVEILKVDGDRVAFAADVGTAVAGWHDVPPTVGRVYFVELSTHDTPTWGQDIVATSGGAARIAPDGDGVVIDAVLERIDADGLAFLRIGSSLFFFSTEGAAPAAGTPIRVRLATLTLFDTRI